MQDNYFAVGFAILDKLKQTNQFKQTEWLQTLAAVGEHRQITPAAFVVYRGSSVTDTSANGSKTVIAHRYGVILSFSHAAAQRDVGQMTQAAGEIIPAALRQLQGWQPMLDGRRLNARPLKQIGGENPYFSTAFSYYPFIFESTTVL